MFSIFISSILLILIYMTGIFVLSLIKKDNSIVDVAYGVGFILLVISTNIISETQYLSADLVSILICIWAIRLSTRIYFRNKNKPEDFRYKNWRTNSSNHSKLIL